MHVTESSISSSIVSSSPNNTYEDSVTTSVKNNVKELLKSRIFLGRYVERRLVDKSIGYRDIVVVSPAEVELKRDLLESQHKLRSINQSKWIGITDNDFIGYKNSGVCLWTEIDNQPFGAFWFQIKTVQYRNAEVILRLKCLRHITDSFLEAEPILTGSAKVNKISSTEFKSNTETLGETFNEIKGTLKSALTITNVKEFFTFLAAFIIAIFTGSSAFITFLGNFVLALVRETSILVKASTPLFLGFLDFLSKIVGGFYILLAMLFKPNTPNPMSRRTVQYNDRPNYNEFDSRYID